MIAKSENLGFLNHINFFVKQEKDLELEYMDGLLKKRFV